MRRITILTLVLLVALALGAYADTSGKVSASVFAVVNPNISCGVITSLVDAGTHQTGEFSADIVFRIDANEEAVNIYAEASPLYKGEQVVSPLVTPIPLALSKGIVINPDDAAPFPGYDEGGKANYIGSFGDIAGYPTVLTETIPFESSQAGHFSQNVVLSVTWDQDDPERPQGIYWGKVGLTAFLL